jgi:hypothetical protein
VVPARTTASTLRQKGTDDVHRGVEDVPRVSSAGETQTEPQQRPEERPPGQFVSDELQSDCTRFLEEIKNVVRRRSEAGLGRDRAPR